MENKKFSFGIVKGIEMREVLNNKRIYGNFSGLKYLYNQLQRTSYPLIKKEIEECVNLYAKNYVITFGKYKDKTVEEIDTVDRLYLKQYLAENAAEEVKFIIDQYYKSSNSDNSSAYNAFQENEYKKVAKLTEEIHAKSEREIIIVLNMLGLNYKDNKGFIKCPFCGYQKKGRWPSYLKKGKEQTYYIGCEKCGCEKNIIMFVKEEFNITYPQAVKKLSGLLGIMEDVSVDDLVIREFKPKNDDEIKIQYCNLAEVDLEPFGFVKGALHPYFYHRGFNKTDAKEFGISFSGKYCTNNFKGRICFTIRDTDGRCVGVIGRSVENEKEFYDRMIKKLNISKDFSYDKQLGIVMDKYEYKKYMFTNGFKKSFTLYNIDKAIKTEKNELFICEGTTDVVTMVNKYGYAPTVGMMGKELGLGQLYQLYTHYKDVRDTVKIYLFIDNDAAGLQGMETNIKYLQELGFTKLYKMVLNHGNDAADSCYQQVKDAYNDAELIPIKYKKKKIILEDVDINTSVILEDA